MTNGTFIWRKMAAASRLLRPVGRNSDIQSLAAADGALQRAHRLLERCGGVEAVRIENVDVVETHALETLIQAGEQIFAGSPLAVGTRPHEITRLR